MSETRNELLDRWLESPSSTEHPKAAKAPSGVLGEAFITELCRSWETHGQAALAHVASQKPDIYLKLVASFVSKDVEPSGAFDDVSDAELAALIVAARAALEAHELTESSGDDQG